MQHQRRSRRLNARMRMTMTIYTRLYWNSPKLLKWCVCRSVSICVVPLAPICQGWRCNRRQNASFADSPVSACFPFGIRDKCVACAGHDTSKVRCPKIQRPRSKPSLLFLVRTAICNNSVSGLVWNLLPAQCHWQQATQGLQHTPTCCIV